MQEKYLQEIAQRFAVPVVQVPLLAHEVKGIPMLIELGQQVYGRVLTSNDATTSSSIALHN